MQRHLAPSALHMRPPVRPPPRHCAPAPARPASLRTPLRRPPRLPLRRAHLLRAAAAQRTPLSAAGRASAATGAYISLAGACLLAAPLRTLGLLFDVSSSGGITAPWVRVLGVLSATFGAYYLGAAALEARGVAPPIAFYRSTVCGRLALCAAFALLVATGAFPQRGLLLVRCTRRRGARDLRAFPPDAGSPSCRQLGAVNAAGAAAMHLALRSDAAAALRT